MKYYIYIIAIIFSFNLCASDDRQSMVKAIEKNFNTGHYHLNAQMKKIVETAQDMHVQELQNIKIASDRDVEMFVYFLNKLSLQGGQSLPSIANKASKMLQLYKLPLSNKQKIQQLFKKINIDIGFSDEFVKRIFFQAVVQDEDVKEAIAQYAADLKTDVFLRKQTIIGQLEEEVNDAILQEIKRTAHQTSMALELDRLEEDREDLNMQHNARLYYIIKSCKDMVFALRPMCSGSQELCMVVDRHTYAPVVNLIDPAVLPEDPFEKNIVYADLDGAELQNKLQQIKKAALKKGYVLKIPKHRISQQSFLEKLRAIYWNHHPQDDNLNASSSSIGSDWCIIEMDEVKDMQEPVDVGYGQWAYDHTIGLVTATACRLKWW